MPDRQRVRKGRAVLYHPTAAEVTANGAGPWNALITDVNSDGSVDLLCDVPGDTTVAAALAAPLITTADADATFGQPEADLVNELKADVNIMTTLVNQLRTIVLNQRKTSVLSGTTAGRYSFQVGSQAV